MTDVQVRTGMNAMLDHGLARKRIGYGPASAILTPRRRSDTPAAPLRIGLLNNMPDPAFRQTELQFRRLIGSDVTLCLFSFAETPRSGPVQVEVAARYQSHRALSDARLDGLVVTGCEPLAARLDEEPFFKPLGEVIDWASRHTISTLFSCLASHAAVLHRDGIERRRLPAKCSGVFDCFQANDGHALLDGLGASSPVPHSRWNAIEEADLAAHGYKVLRRSDAIGVDLFVRQEQSLLVFLQGHPEYDPDSLAREYRRDVGRYLDGTSDRYPGLTEHYFTAAGSDRMRAFEKRAQATRDPDLFASFPDLAACLPARPRWEPDAQRLFRNWLRLIATRRAAVADRVMA